MRTINNKRKHKNSQYQNHSKNHSLTSLAALLLNKVEHIVFAVDDVLVHLTHQSYQLIHGTVRRRLTI